MHKRARGNNNFKSEHLLLKQKVHENIKDNSKTERRLVEDNNQRRYAYESIIPTLYDSVETSSCILNNDKSILTDEQ